MKKSLLLLLLPFLCGCSEKEEPIGGPVIGPTYLIARYVEGDMKLDYIPRTTATDGKSNTLYIDWADTEEYYNPDLEKYNLGRQEFWTPENKAKYLEIAKRNGDEIGAYEGGTPPGLYFGDQIALADNFTSMHITSDADWDEEHPAGTLLDDILSVRMYSFAEFIRNGYHDLAGNKSEPLGDYRSLQIIQKRVSELTSDDMEIIAYSISDMTLQTKSPVIVFTSAPTLEKEHTLTLRWTTVEGAVKTASITCTPEVDPTLQ